MRNEAIVMADRQRRRTVRGASRTAAVIAACGWAVVMVWPRTVVLAVTVIATLLTAGGYGWASWDAATAAARGRRDRHRTQSATIDHDSVR